MENRMTEKIVPNLLDQFGFRLGKGTRESMQALQLIFRQKSRGK